MNAPAKERHRFQRTGWLRASVLGANDGVVSTASLVIGVAAAGATSGSLMVTGVAGLVAGAMSMAAGEYVSVHSQADTEAADLARERRELAALYVARGVEPALASTVAAQLMARDPLAAHAHDELGMSPAVLARPVQAALSSAASFAVGAALPLGVTMLAIDHALIAWVAGSSLLFLALLGGAAARMGGAAVLAGAWRVTFWGAMAMAITAAAGSVFEQLLSPLP